MPDDPKQFTLDGEMVDPPEIRQRRMWGRRKLAAMVGVYGLPPENVKCGDCLWFRRIKRNVNVYRKCEIFGDSRGPGTDWLAGWTGCGKWEEATDESGEVLDRSG